CVRELLTADEWRRLKSAYEDFAVDVGRSVDALLVRAGAAPDAAERLAPRRVREIRELAEALSFAAGDIDDRFAAFERKLNGFVPPSAEGR
ncbi:MAG: hypothetical protein AABY08_05790, partial [Candidatus Thermoplasmatota archaeon]